MNSSIIKIAPSILSADFHILGEQVKTVEAAGADIIHCDIMDGHFVPNISFGPLVLKALKPCTRLPLTAHLMISDPRMFIKPFCEAGAARIIIHAEIKDNLSELLQLIKAAGMECGVSINPDTRLESIKAVLPLCDEVLVMTVFPGFGGQQFIADTLPKIKALRELIRLLDKTVEIAADGGINAATAAQCAQAGATVFIAGNFIFASDEPARRIMLLRNAAKIVR